MKHVLLFLVTSMPAAASAQNGTLPQYAPHDRIAGPEIIRSWGEPRMATLMASWERGFTEQQPNVRFSDKLLGTENAQAALYAHVADLAVMGREILMLERHVMFRREHRLPLEIMVATGSYDVEAKSNALAVFVSKANPIQHLTVAQLDGIFGDQRTGAWDDKFLWHPELGRGPEKNIRTWGQLGRTGEWSDKPIHVYGYPVSIYSPTSGPMMSFRKVAFHGGDMWNPQLQEYDGSERIIAAMQDDPYAIGYGCLCDGTPRVKALALAMNAEGPYIELTRNSVAARTYPLTRSVYIYIDHIPGEPLDPKVKEFLTYVLSKQGQQAVTAEGDYLPLSPSVAAEERRKLE